MERLSRKEKNKIIRDSQNGPGPKDGWTPEMRARKEEALGPNPHGGFNHDALGSEFFRVGLWDKATAEFERAVRLNPWKTIFKVHLARAFLAWGKVAEADRTAQAAVIQSPALADAALTMALVRERKGDRLQAIVWYERCLAAGPDYWVRQEAEEGLKTLKAVKKRIANGSHL